MTSEEASRRLTYAQAATILDCHVSNIPGFIARRDLTKHEPISVVGKGRGQVLDRDEVEAL